MTGSALRMPQSLRGVGPYGPEAAIKGLVVIAASAGGISPLTEVISKLPKGLEAAVIVVQHLSPEKETALPELLNRSSNLQVSLAKHGMAIEAGNVYVAGPGKHLLVEGEVLSVTLSERDLYVRPCADLLFVSAAKSFGQRVIGVVLSETGKDGVLGCIAIKAKGGVTLAQDEATARYYGMPGNAINEGAIDFVLPPNEIADKVVELIGRTKGD